MCGLEHFSNCHGEWNFLFFFIPATVLWFRTQWNVTLNYFKEKFK